MGEIIGDEVVAVAMIDRVHHAEILWLKGAATACAIAYWAAPRPPERLNRTGKPGRGER